MSLLVGMLTTIGMSINFFVSSEAEVAVVIEPTYRQTC